MGSDAELVKKLVEAWDKIEEQGPEDGEEVTQEKREEVNQAIDDYLVPVCNQANPSLDVNTTYVLLTCFDKSDRIDF